MPLAPACALTAVTGTVNWVKVHSDDGTYDTCAGFQFEIGNSPSLSSTTELYVFSNADTDYEDALLSVMTAYLMGVQDTNNNALCSSERAVNPQLGTRY